MEHAVTAMKNGAYDYLTKPFDLTALDAIIVKAGKAAELTGKIDQLKEELQDQYSLGRSIIGDSQPMQEIYKVLGRVAGSDVTVLVTGESGTGKELVARAIHINSQRLGKPFMRQFLASYWRQNCSVMSGVPLLVPQNVKQGNLSRPMGGPCFWMRSVICRQNYRPSYYGCYRKKRSPAPAVARF